ncbi:hypothetical protein NSP01_23880, partial [Salmonella enterica]|nr:hypothetical protein [Salmonella enterica]
MSYTMVRAGGWAMTGAAMASMTQRRAAEALGRRLRSRGKGMKTSYAVLMSAVGRGVGRNPSLQS